MASAVAGQTQQQSMSRESCLPAAMLNTGRGEELHDNWHGLIQGKRESVVAQLQACVQSKDLCRNTRIYEEFQEAVPHGMNVHFGVAMLNMYAKFGELEKAQEVFDELPIQTVVSWNVLISGFVRHGYSHKALSCYSQMQDQGIIPDAVTFTCILKACSSVKSVEMVKEIHAKVARQGLLMKDSILGNALVDIYAKNNALVQAQNVADELPSRDNITWSALIAGYAQRGQGHEALNCFKLMKSEGLFPDAATLTSAFKACGHVRAGEKSIGLHAEAIRQGLLVKDAVLCTALVDMYAKCGHITKAEEMFCQLHVRDIVCWNTLLSCYVQLGYGHEALTSYEKMREEGLLPDFSTFCHILRACSIIGDAKKGENIHTEISRQHLVDQKPFLGTLLVDMYASCYELEKAREVFNRLSPREVITWNALITGYAQQGHDREVLNCFELMQHEGVFSDAVTFSCALKACGSVGAAKKGEDLHAEVIKEGLLDKSTSLGDALVDMYFKCGSLSKAQEVFDELLTRSTASWSVLIAGYVEHGHGHEALRAFEQMQHEGLLPDTVTFVCVLKACGSIGAVNKGKEIHAMIDKQHSLQKDVLLGTVLVDMYAKCHELAKAQKLFDKLPGHDVVCWNTLIAGYTHHGHNYKALNCYKQMLHEDVSPDALTFIHVLKSCGSLGAAGEGANIHLEIMKRGLLKNDISLGTALVDMYMKCGLPFKAEQIFNELSVRSLDSWNVLICGYAQHGQSHKVLTCVEWMMHEGVHLDSITFSCILYACGSIGAVTKGEEIHAELTKQGLLEKDTILGSIMVDMYINCGTLAKAQEVFDELPVCDVVSWSALLAGYAQIGKAEFVFSLFNKMICDCVHPDMVTFIIILNVCSHSGLVEEGQSHVITMSLLYGIIPTIEHHTCMVDLFSRAGDFDKALRLIEKLSLLKSANLLPSWSAILGACQQWENVEMGRFVFENVVQLNDKDAASYVCMRNLFFCAWMLDEAEKVEDMRMKNNLWKITRMCLMD